MRYATVRKSDSSGEEGVNGRSADQLVVLEKVRVKKKKDRKFENV